MDQKISPESECEEEERLGVLSTDQKPESSRNPEGGGARVSGVREGARPVGASSGPFWKLWGRVLIVTLPPIS